MNRLWMWVKSHKTIVVLSAVIVFLVIRNNPRTYTINSFDTGRSDAYTSYPEMGSIGSTTKSSPIMPPLYREAAPDLNTTERMVIENSYLSLLVKNVNESFAAVKAHTEQIGGYMVQGSINNPNDNANATITVRVPTARRDETLTYLKSQAVKVVSENLEGTDVTDQYTDLDEQLRILNRNKTRIEELMDRAVEVSDILKIQQELFGLQRQIDDIVGRQDYLKKTSESVKFTVYLSTDELALPYTPDRSWRPSVKFKEAVRNLVMNIQDVGSLLIWAAVYSVIILPLIGIAFIIKRIYFTRKKITA